MVFTVTIAIFVLGVLIFVHELGHFLAAKLVGIQVLRFSIGFGKPIVSRYWGETEYSLSWIPFGGGVRRCAGAPFAEMEMREVLDDELNRTLGVRQRPGRVDHRVAARLQFSASASYCVRDFGCGLVRPRKPLAE